MKVCNFTYKTKLEDTIRRVKERRSLSHIIPLPLDKGKGVKAIGLI